MAFQIFAVSVFALLVQGMSCQCIRIADNDEAGRYTDRSCYNMGAGFHTGNTGLTSLKKNSVFDEIDMCGGPLLVRSYSPIGPHGVWVLSEQRLEGDLSVAGKLPLLGAVSLDGMLPATGDAQVGYGCGNGNVRIIETFGSNYDSAANNFAYNSGASVNFGMPLGTEATSRLGIESGAVNAHAPGSDINYGAGVVSEPDIQRCGYLIY